MSAHAAASVARQAERRKIVEWLRSEPKFWLFGHCEPMNHQMLADCIERGVHLSRRGATYRAAVVPAQGIETAKPPRREAGSARKGESPAGEAGVPKPNPEGT
jgi:hypothetical protein